MLTKSEDYANPYHHKIFQDMIDKYKIVSLVLTLSLIAALVRLVYSTNIAGPSAPQDDKASVLKIIHERKSVRSFTEQPVSREQLDTLVRAWLPQQAKTCSLGNSLSSTTKKP